MKTHIIMALASIFFFTGCNCQKKAQKKTEINATPKSNAQASTMNPTPQKEGNTYTFREGENKFLKNEQMNVTFVKTIEDSRCPEGTNCIWQGVAAIEVNLMSTHSRPYTVQLYSNFVPGKAYRTSVMFNGYTVKLESLTPNPTVNAGFDQNKGKYKAVLKIVNGEINDPNNLKPIDPTPPIEKSTPPTNQSL